MMTLPLSNMQNRNQVRWYVPLPVHYVTLVSDHFNRNLGGLWGGRRRPISWPLESSYLSVNDFCWWNDWRMTPSFQ